MEKLLSLKGSNFAFFVCEMLRSAGVHLCGQTIVSELGDEYENTDENMTYFIERMFYKNDCFETDVDVGEIVAKYRYIFVNELSSKETLVSLLLND